MKMETFVYDDAFSFEISIERSDIENIADFPALAAVIGDVTDDDPFERQLEAMNNLINAIKAAPRVAQQDTEETTSA